MTTKSQNKIAQHMEGKKFYEEALQFCILNKPDYAIRRMKKAIKAGYPPASQALKEITEMIDRENAK